MPTLALRTGCPSPASAPRERGQVLILFVMGATVIFLIGAIVVDIGLWVSERRNAQAAADLASLAAATQLRNANASGDAQAKGLDFAKRNGFDYADSNIDVQVNPDTSNETVEVTIDEQGVSLFAGIFGITSPHVGASAVAAYGESPPGPGWVLFANSSDCNPNSPPLNILANHVTVNGSTHSNGNLHIEGPQDDFVGPVTWVCPGGFNQAPDQQNTGSYQPAPYPVGSQPAASAVGSWSDVPCTVTVPPGTNINNNPALWDIPGVRLKSNVICSDGDLSLSGDGISGHVTFASNQGQITITSTGSTGNQLQPADSLPSSLADLLAVSFASPTSGAAIDIAAAGGLYRGIIHAPNSQIALTGSSNVNINGILVADTILLSGNNFRMTALPGLSGPPLPPEIHLED
ncbi:MAG: hypothetical protein E6I38_09750 [Chloroflexi bacterium]|nr:MAG: hypothetical protein E6I38_09750 [Chloroflexota bacterium]